ncbi:MAG: family 78 glycoside hydrolase catalytic domain, partial [Cyclobacteriaceae bacterium]|nr:family 78 glycoside hydrolase catalytic domain [Cyclobacteriaceae bacterium]
MNKISSNIIRYSLLIALVGLGIAAYSQPPTQTKWEAYWIAHPEDKGQDFGVYLFRKSIDFEQIPQNLNVYVSADNRYKLFVNGQLVAKGPARDDLAHWRYETVDIAPYLIHGRNTVAAQVWNMGEYRPMAQHTLRTGFILQSDKAELNSNETWKVMRDYSIIPLPVDNTKLQTYIVVGPGEITDGNKFPWGWEVGKDNNSSWVDAKPIDRGTPKGVGTDQTWQLVPREIPFMEEKIVRFKECRRIEGAVKDKNWLNKSDLIIPAKSKATLLLDQGVLNVGYPVMKISGGKNAEITLTYAESLTDKEGNKGNRNEILNKEIKGNQDIIISDGEKGREYTTLWLRTFRYVALDIVTGDEPLIVEDLYSFFSAYPFEQKAVFKSDQTWINDVLEVGWRTARLCAGETYFDCPYYEQMQYVGDTRIQALISVYQTGDARLFKKSIDLFDHSRFDEGLTRSRYPSYAPQVIPTYSLFWVNMLHDYWMHVPDEEYIKSKLFGIKSVLDWFDKQVDEKTGLIGNTPYWNFVDWTPEWRWDNEIGQGGVPDLEGGSSIVSLQYAYSLDAAADLHEYFGEGHEAEKYRSISQRIKNQVMISCFDEEKG